jgi:hypothetical protein
VNGSGVDSAQEGLGIYGWCEDATFTVASLGSDAVASGYLATTAAGVVVAGRFTSANQLFAISPEAFAARMSGGPVIDLDAATPFLTGSYGALAGFGDAVAIATYDASTWLASGLVDVSLPIDGGAVTPGSPVPMLTQTEGCTTAMPFVTPLQGDVVVGLALPSGVAVVRIARE